MIKNEDGVKIKNGLNLFVLIDRTNFTFIHTIQLVMYTSYCIFNFQLKLSYQNLWIITLGLFVIICVYNTVLTAIILLPFKVAFKKLTKKCFENKNNDKKDEIQNNNNEARLLMKDVTDNDAANTK